MLLSVCDFHENRYRGGPTLIMDLNVINIYAPTVKQYDIQKLTFMNQCIVIKL